MIKAKRLKSSTEDINPRSEVSKQRMDNFKKLTHYMQQSTSQTVVRGKERKRLTESGNKRKCKDCKSKQTSAWGSMTAIAFHI